MNRIFRIITKGFIYGGCVSASLLGTGYLYIKYIDYVLDPNGLINRQQTINYYKQDLKIISKLNANVIYSIAATILTFSRLNNFDDYSQACKILCKKILIPIVQNYQKEQIIEEIQRSLPIRKNKVFAKILQKIDRIKLVNKEKEKQAIPILEYIFKMQKILFTIQILNLNAEAMQKLDKIQKYVCEIKLIFKDQDIESYLAHKKKLQELKEGIYLITPFII